MHVFTADARVLLPQVFGRVVDPENFAMRVYSGLNAWQVELADARIGCLRLFSPANPTGTALAARQLHELGLTGLVVGWRVNFQVNFVVGVQGWSDWKRVVRCPLAQAWLSKGVALTAVGLRSLPAVRGAAGKYSLLVSHPAQRLVAVRLLELFCQQVRPLTYIGGGCCSAGTGGQCTWCAALFGSIHTFTLIQFQGQAATTACTPRTTHVLLLGQI
jgi:hypothetical protein